MVGLELVSHFSFVAHLKNVEQAILTNSEQMGSIVGQSHTFNLLRVRLNFVTSRKGLDFENANGAWLVPLSNATEKGFSGFGDHDLREGGARIADVFIFVA